MNGMSFRPRDRLWELMLTALAGSRIHRLFAPVYGGLGHIMMLHRVVPQKRNNCFNADIEITPQELSDLILDFKNKNYSIVSLDEIYHLLQHQNNNIKFVAFTFDDGYQEIFTYAYPIFKKFNLPFTLYLTTGFLDNSGMAWWYPLENLILANDQISFQYNNKEYCFDCSSLGAKYNAFKKLRQLFINQYEEQSLAAIFRKYNLDAYKTTAEISLTWEQVKKLSRDPLVTLGSHTASHRCLKALSLEEARNDILSSVTRLESQIQKKVEHFSYPFGQKENGPREFALVRQLGFKTAVTTRFANIFPKHRHHLVSLPRIYPVSRRPLLNYLDLLTTGTLSALRYRFQKVVTE